MRRTLALLLAGLCSAAAATAQTLPIFNSRITGTVEVKSGGELEVESGATLDVQSGATVTFGAPLSLANGGTGVALTDPAADRLVFWDDSAGAIGWLTIGSGLSLSGTELTSTGSFSNPMTAVGDIIIGGTDGAAEALAVGTDGQILTLVSGAPAWAAAPTSGFANPMTTAEDLIVGGTSGAAGRLAVGTDGQVLKVVSGAVAWAADSTGSGSLPGTPSAGDVVYYDGSDWVSLAIGTAAQVLTVNAGATAPEWAAASGGSGGTATLARWTALGNQPPASSYATWDTRNSVIVLDFDPTLEEIAVFVGMIPEGADLSVGISVRLVWMATTQTTGDVKWESALERGNTDLDTDSFGTAKTVTTTVSSTSGIAVVSTINHDTGEIDGLTAGDLFRLKIRRVGNDVADTMGGDAELITLEIRSR